MKKDKLSMVFVIFGLIFSSSNGIVMEKSEIIPLEYDLTIEPDFNDASFKGNVTIRLQPLQESNEIVLDNDLGIRNVVLTTMDGRINNPILNITFNWVYERLTITLGEKLQPQQEYLLRIEFDGKLNTNNLGFYLGKYLDENGTEKLFASTQFSKTNAHSAFPCFDQPALKASFVIKIIRPRGYHSLSNEEIFKTVNGTNMVGVLDITFGVETQDLNQIKSHSELDKDRFLDEYKKIHNISTYLVAFTVSQFDFTQKNGIHQVAGRSELLNEGKAEYALKMAPVALKAVEDYVDMKFSFPKITHLAIPDRYSTAEASENLGLIVYKEKALLIPKETSVITQKQSVVTTMLHELIHQWFGNLVTPAQWRYFWMSEGFATYLQFRIGNIMDPSWKLMDQFYQAVTQVSFQGETFIIPTSLNNSDAMWVPYVKAASIIRMLEHFLTPQVFQKGLQYYLKTKYNQFL